jgi:hypothetical protein
MAYGMKRDIPRMETVHHQDVTVELSTHLLAAQREIKTLRMDPHTISENIGMGNGHVLVGLCRSGFY